METLRSNQAEESGAKFGVWSISEGEAEAVRLLVTRGDTERLDELLEDLAAEYLAANSEEFHANLKVLRVTANREAQEAARNRQRLLFDETKANILAASSASKQ